MKLGLNLSFAVKRWLEPQKLAFMCRSDFGITNVQFTWDLIDPWWPQKERDLLAVEYKSAFEKEGVKIDATFGGLAAYTYAQMLAPSPVQRAISVDFFKRAVDLTRAMDSEVLGTPVGGMTYEDANNKERRAQLYNILLEEITDLSLYGAKRGLKEIHIEATPLLTEFPHSPEVSLKLMEDLRGTAIPVKLLIDWGHALFKPLLKNEADMELWLRQCAPYVGSIHLQQTDGLLDRHWDFTKEGIVTPDLIKNVIANAGLDYITQYVEVVPPFEETDDAVYLGIKQTMDYLRRNLAC